MFCECIQEVVGGACIAFSFFLSLALNLLPGLKLSFLVCLALSFLCGIALSLLPGLELSFLNALGGMPACYQYVV